MLGFKMLMEGVCFWEWHTVRHTHKIPFAYSS